MGGSNSILEGDYFLAIQWGPGRACHPWILADSVEEVQDIFNQPGALFHHNPREAKVMTNSLAKDGVFHSSISFDIYCSIYLFFFPCFRFGLSDFPGSSFL